MGIKKERERERDRQTEDKLTKPLSTASIVSAILGHLCVTGMSRIMAMEMHVGTLRLAAVMTR